MKYLCVISSNFSDRVYEVETTSALKCALLYGRCEGGEVVTVIRKRSAKVLSEVRWDIERKQYYHCVHD